MANNLSKKLLLEKFPHVKCNVLRAAFRAHNYSLHSAFTTLRMSTSVNKPGILQKKRRLLGNSKGKQIKIKEEWKQQSQDSMANNLSKKLLLEKFPHVKCNVLRAAFRAHNYSLHSAFTTLRMSTSVNKPGILQKKRRLLGNSKGKQIKIKKSKETNLFTYIPSCRSHTHKLALGKRSMYHYYKLRRECYSKMLYRSVTPQLAELYNVQLGLCNSLVATYLVHVRRNKEVLDLHFLHIREAKQVLHLFLDESIAQLREKQQYSKVLCVITGRGLHSAGGIPSIKIMVAQELRKRNIEFCEPNPGRLLFVVYYKQYTTQSKL